MVKARRSYDITTDGLAHSWRGHGLVFMNPPHSFAPNNIEPWIQKVIDEFITHPIEREMNNTMDAFVGLIPSKTGPRWFHNILPLVDGRCFVKGRIRFWQHGAEREGAGKFDSIVIYIGSAYGNFYREFSDFGWVI